MPMGPDGAFLDAVSVDRGSAILLHRQIYDGLRDLVLPGPPSSNARLTSMRMLTRELEVSKTKIRRAFNRLAADGFLCSGGGCESRMTALGLGCVETRDAG